MDVAWKKYQEDAATLFRSLGFSAKVEANIQGARSLHNVDVLVTFNIGGVPVQWIVECKRWKSRVSKVHVAALSEIVKDLGADRAFMLSEVGFQAGAVSLATHTNISLTSLEELRTDALDDVRRVRSLAILRQTAILEEQLRRFLYDERGQMPALRLVDFDSVVELLADCLVINLALKNSSFGLYPRQTCFQLDVVYETPDDLLDNLANLIGTIEERTAKLEQSQNQQRQQAIEEVRSFTAAVTALLEAAEHSLLSRFPDDIAFEASRLCCLDAMKRVGVCAEPLKAILSGSVGRELHTLMRLLIDTVYLHLSKPSIPEGEWIACRVVVELQRDRLILEFTQAVSPAAG
jgi:hypothetical protein